MHKKTSLPDDQIQQLKWVTKLPDDEIQQLQKIDFWNTNMDEIKPTCNHADCDKFATFDGLCHFHSNTSGNPCLFACCKDEVFNSSANSGEPADTAKDIDVFGEVEEGNDARVDSGQENDDGAKHDENEHQEENDDEEEEEREEDEHVPFHTENSDFESQYDDFDDCAVANNALEEQPTTLATSTDPGSAFWEIQYRALNAYVHQHGQPPQTREENPTLYDWLQGQKARQRQMENLFNSC